MKPDIKKLIEHKDYEGISQLLAGNPNLVNEGITIPYDSKSAMKAHPLHRICDAVFAKKITDEEAIRIATIFLDFGTNINGAKIKENEDTPLLAAASLHAEQLGIFYIDNGADIHYKGRHDGATALHWAAYCGRDKLVERLISEKAIIDLRDTSYNSTPLAWAIQPLLTGDKINTFHQVACIKLLLKAGADITTPRKEADLCLRQLANDDLELKKLLN
ncbi:ankyrin repeat domain-containing protein [Terrimonas pollutisoli]|uniref:ankyrin repeat domain-containing protein n=1 Tax=Terrimonas pollutisoli TaxID=3034147 RepID=UPI0023EE0666|nr:ankyrin repeat domain-containing protein [Terrimonas sp. H1YJ31]